jgi:hypothetical protein
MSNKETHSNKRKSRIVLPFILLTPFLAIYIFAKFQKSHFVNLEYYGTPTIVNGDTIPFQYTFPKLKNIDESPFDLRSLEGYNVILSNVQLECPQDCGISKPFIDEIIYDHIVTSPKHFGDIKILSLITDKQGNSQNINPGQNYWFDEMDTNKIWSFVEGDVKEFYNFTTHDSLFTELKGNFPGYPKLFSNSLVFIDKNRNIRAVYEGKTEAGVRQFMDMIRLWNKEQDNK